MAVNSAPRKTGSSESGVWHNPHCPAGHALQKFVEDVGGECDGCGAAVHASDTVMDCRTCDWYLCGGCSSESNMLHCALIACLTDADVEPAVRRAVMTMHHHSPQAKEAKDLDYLRAKLRQAAYDREDNGGTFPKGQQQRLRQEERRRLREQNKREAPHRFKESYTTTDWCRELNFYRDKDILQLDSESFGDFVREEANEDSWFDESQESMLVLQKLRQSAKLFLSSLEAGALPSHPYVNAEYAELLLKHCSLLEAEAREWFAPSPQSPQDVFDESARLLDMGQHPTISFGEMSLATLQLLFAKFNNAELQALYNKSSYTQLRDLARTRRISVTHTEKQNVQSLRMRLANVDRCWLQNQRLHALHVTLEKFTTPREIDDVIYVQFGCMPREMANKYFVVKRGEVDDERKYVQVTPGRGKPRIRFRRKLPGLVPNMKMKSLLNEARGRLDTDSTDEERAAKRRRCIAELQQKWRPLEADGYRLVSLLLTCSRDGNIMGIDLNDAFASALRREDLYRRPDESPKVEAAAFCKSIGLRVHERRHREDYADSIKAYASGRRAAYDDSLQDEEQQHKHREVSEVMSLINQRDMQYNPDKDKRDSLAETYKTMSVPELLAECHARKLASVRIEDESQDDHNRLFLKLTASDQYFDSLFQDSSIGLIAKTEQANAELEPLQPFGAAIEDLPVLRLKALAQQVGISLGNQSHEVLVANLEARRGGKHTDTKTEKKTDRQTHRQTDGQRQERGADTQATSVNIRRKKDTHTDRPAARAGTESQRRTNKKRDRQEPGLPQGTRIGHVGSIAIPRDGRGRV